MNILQMIQAHADEVPDRQALVYLPDGDSKTPTSVTYRELADRIITTGKALSKCGISTDDVVGVVPLLTPDSFIAILGAATFATCHPINILASAQSIGGQIESLNVKIVLSEFGVAGLDLTEKLTDIPERVQKFFLGDGPTRDSERLWNSVLADDHLGTTLPKVTRSNEASLIFATGGTTGSPKMAVLTVSNVIAGCQIYAKGAGLNSQDRVLSGLPLFHVGGLIDLSLGVLAAGGTVIFPSALGMRHPTVLPQLWEIISSQCATLVGLVPSSLALLDSIGPSERPAGTLRGIITGSSPLSLSIARSIEEKYRVPIIELYGMTETSGIISCNNVDNRELGTVGQLCDGVRVRIGSPITPLPIGESGEIYVSGPNVFSGYTDAEKTKAAFVQEDWFATGDLGCIDEAGRLIVSGRSKDIIIRSGHNIDPVAIEEIAMRHEAVELAAAVGLPDEVAGELPVLFIKLKQGSCVEIEEITAHMRAKIHDAPARPRHLEIVQEMPMTPLGKIFKPTLRETAKRRFLTED